MPSDRAFVFCYYRYDPLDRLVATSPSGQSPLQRFYCKTRLATEIQGLLRHTIIQHDDQLLAQLQRNGVQMAATLLATDQQRSVLHALGSGVRHPIAYAPYGHHPADSGLLSLLGFNGERRDPVTGHYLLGNGYRAFNPVLMRFNSPDSWSPFGEGGVNPYVYCLGDPTNRSDRNGHAPPLTLLIQNQQLLWSKPIATTSTATTTPMGLFEKLRGMPHITEAIIRHLPTNDLISLASTSKAMKDTVYSAATPVSTLLGQANTPAQLENNLGLITAARRIASGEIQGMLPAQLNQAGINPNYIPIIEIPPGSGYVSRLDMQSRYQSEQAAKIRQATWRINNLYNRPNQY